MGNTFRLALKNLTRQKRRNAILATAIAFGFLVVTAIDGFTSGVVGNLENMITQLTGGNILVAGYEKIPAEEEGKKDELIGIIKDRNYIRNIVENSNIDYEYFSCYTQTAGQFVFNGKKALSTVFGRDLSEESLRESFQIVEGSFDNFDDPQALIISDKLAETLNITVGDQLIYTTSTIYGQNNVTDFTVAAIIKGNTFLSSMQTYANIETINKLVEIPEGGYSTFTIFLKNKNKQAKYASYLEELIRRDGANVSSRLEAMMTNPGNIGKGIEKQFMDPEQKWEGVKYVVECLDDEVPQLNYALYIVHFVTTCILIVILLIVMVGVSNTYRMVLYERIREIGTMRALGMTGKQTRRVFTTEAVILCVIGALCGFILAGILMGIVHMIPINSEALGFFLNNGHFSFSVSPFTTIFQYVLLILLTTVAVRTSAKKAAKLSPAEALRTIK